MPGKTEPWLTPVSRMIATRSGGDAHGATASTASTGSNGSTASNGSNGSNANSTSGPTLTTTPIQAGGVDTISAVLMTANANPFLVGMFMLLLNLGGRFLTLELSKKQEAFLQAPWVRPLIFFTVVFVATRNLAAAFWVTLAFFFVIWVVANENSPFCMIPSWCGHDTEKAKDNYLKNIQTLF